MGETTRNAPQEIPYSNPPELGETYSSDWLPPLDDLGNDLRYLLANKQNRKWRMDVALEYVDFLRSKVQPQNAEVSTEVGVDQHLPSLIFLDSMALIMNQRIYMKGTARYGRHAPETFDDLKELLAVKRSMQVNMGLYTRVNQRTPSLVLFNNLWGTMNYARRLIYNDEVITEHNKMMNASNLFGMLAENKVVEALKEDRWPQADHASISQDSMGIDVVVPIGAAKESGVALQVKTHQQPNEVMFIHPNGKPAVKVVVPMNPMRNDPFKLARSSAEQINNYISNAPRTRFKLAA